jgi:hypothetical protein
MKEIGVPNVLTNAFYSMFKSDEFSLIIDGECGRFFKATSGVKEGAISSPILFTLFFEQVVEFLVDCQNDTPILGGVKYPMLMYADDIILMSLTKAGLQSLIDKFELFCMQKKLEINVR